MDGRLEHGTVAELPIDVLTSGEQQVPLVLASPHSGADYPAEFLAASRLDPLTLRRSEDSYVDEIFSGVPPLGAPLVIQLSMS